MRPPFYLDYTNSWPAFAVNFAVLMTSVLGFRDFRDLGYREASHRDHIPKPRFLKGETNVTFHVGATATLRCGVQDLGTKTVTWKKRGSLEPLTIGEMAFAQRTDYEVHHMDPHWNLLIKNVQLKHDGIYECHVSTRDKMKRTVQLNVFDDHRYHKPLINISGLLHVDKGKSIKLLCNASGSSAPPQLVQWFKDGIEVQASSRVLIKEQYSVMSHTITSWLEIKNAHMDDKGTFTCRASDRQVTSVNVNVLNEKIGTQNERRKERDEEKPQPTQWEAASAASASDCVHAYSRSTTLLCTLLIMWILSWSRDTS